MKIGEDGTSWNNVTHLARMLVDGGIPPFLAIFGANKYRRREPAMFAHARKTSTGEKWRRLAHAPKHHRWREPVIAERNAKTERAKNQR